MLVTIVTRLTFFLTFAVIVASEAELVNSSGTSSILCLIIGSNVALLAGYCQACCLKLTPRNSWKKLKVSSIVDNSDLMVFHQLLSKEFSKFISFIIGWMELMLQLSMLAILIKMSSIVLKIVTPENITSAFKTNIVSVPWSDQGVDLLSTVILSCTFILVLLMMSVTEYFNNKWSTFEYFQRSIWLFITLLIIMAKLIIFTIYVQPHFDSSLYKTWLNWGNTHPKGIEGIASSISVFMLTYSLWSCHTRDDHRRISFILPISTTFLINAFLLLSYCFLIDLNNIKLTLSDPTSLYIFKTYFNHTDIVLLGVMDITILLMASSTLFNPLISCIDLVTFKLGRPVRVDLNTTEVKPRALKKFTAIITILTIIPIIMTCSLHQIISIAESFVLVLSSVNFLLTIRKTYQNTTESKYVRLTQNEPPEAEMETEKDAMYAEKAISSGSDSETDIDAVVEEYKKQMNLDTFDEIQHTTELVEPSKRSYIIIKLAVSITISLTAILSLIVLYVPDLQIVLSACVVWLATTFIMGIIAINQPKNDSFDAKLPLMPMIPLLCLNLCIFLIPFCVHLIWPATIVMLTVGPIVYLSTTCLRQKHPTESEFNSNLNHEHSICLQPLPSQTNNLQTTLVPAHARRLRRILRSKGKAGKFTTNIQFSEQGHSVT